MPKGGREQFHRHRPRQWAGNFSETLPARGKKRPSPEPSPIHRLGHRRLGIRSPWNRPTRKNRDQSHGLGDHGEATSPLPCTTTQLELSSWAGPRSKGSNTDLTPGATVESGPGEARKSLAPTVGIYIPTRPLAQENARTTSQGEGPASSLTQTSASGG